MLNVIIYPAIIRLVRAFPAGFNSRPNSFGVVSGFGDIDSDNLNASMRDGRIGHYWGRKWEASGRDSSQIQYENALVFVRPETISFERTAKQSPYKVCQNIEVGIASLPECEGCAHDRSDTEIEGDNAIVLNQITSELIALAPFNVDIPSTFGGIGESTYWLTPAEVAFLKENDVVFPTFKSCPATLVVTKTTNDFSSFDYGTSGMIITTAKVRVCWCSDVEVGYDFRINEFKSAAYTQCEAC